MFAEQKRLLICVKEKIHRYDPKRGSFAVIRCDSPAVDETAVRVGYVKQRTVWYHRRIHRNKSLTEIHSDGVHNVIPGSVVIKGDTRSLDPVSQKTVEDRLRAICEGICRMNGAECDFEYTYEDIPTVNDPVLVGYAAEAAAKVVGKENVDTAVIAPLTSEDFARFLSVIPGCFVFIGTGRTDNDPALHSANYDFNDNVLDTGAEYFAQLVRDRLK